MDPAPSAPHDLTAPAAAPTGAAALAQAVDARPARPSISVVVPAYNEARNLPPLLEVLGPALAALSDLWEVVVVDDGSRDDTAAALAPWLQAVGQPGARTPRGGGVRLITLSRNFGKEAALSAGLDRARGEVVVLMDADLQHPVALLESMLARWRAGADSVCAVRVHRGDEGWIKRLGTRIFYGIVNAGSSRPIPQGAGDFRLMDRRVVQALCALPERNRFLKGLYAWVGFATDYLPYQPDPRAHGESTFSLRRLRRLAMTGITAFSTLPLRLWSGIGAVIAFAALAYGVWIVISHFISGNPVPGWATLAAGMMFFSGVQLLSIGILGEYLGRVFEEVKGRPIYIVDRELGHSSVPRPPA